MPNRSCDRWAFLIAVATLASTAARADEAATLESAATRRKKTTASGNAYAQRSVFLIDGEGIVRFVEKQYSVGKDKAALYEEVRGLAPPGK